MRDAPSLASSTSPALSTRVTLSSLVDNTGLTTEGYVHHRLTTPFDDAARGPGQGPGSGSSPRPLQLAPIDALEGAQQYAYARTPIDDLQLKALSMSMRSII